MRSFVLLLVLLTSGPAFGWWDAGHKITASIAYRRLTPEERQHVVAVLRQHPRWDTDFAAAMPDDVRTADADVINEWVFQQASVWPDLARNFQGEDRTTYHHATWHYINHPQFLSDADQAALQATLSVNLNLTPPEMPDESMNIVQTIELARRLVADTDTPGPTRAVLLCWLFHTVGDAHQPLHSTTLFSAKLFPDGCRGGNRVKTVQRSNLHSLWDSLPGERLGWREARNRAMADLANPSLDEAGRQAAEVTDAASWLQESHQLAQTVVYDDEMLAELQAAETAGAAESPTIRLTDRYLRMAGHTAERRVVEAGYRLGAVLEEIVP